MLGSVAAFLSSLVVRLYSWFRSRAAYALLTHRGVCPSEGQTERNYLEQTLLVARTFRPTSKQEVAMILAKSQEAAIDGKYEYYKTRDTVDGTSRNLG